MTYISEYINDRPYIKNKLHDPPLVQQLDLGVLEHRLAQRGVTLFVVSSCSRLAQDSSFCIDSQVHGICDIVIDATQIRQTASTLGCTLREVAQSAVLHEYGHLLNIKMAYIDLNCLPSTAFRREETAWHLGKEMAQSLGVSVPCDYEKISEFFLAPQRPPSLTAKTGSKKSCETPTIEELAAKLDRFIQSLEKQVKPKKVSSPSTPVTKANNLQASGETPDRINQAKAKRLGVPLAMRCYG